MARQLLFSQGNYDGAYSTLHLVYCWNACIWIVELEFIDKYCWIYFSSLLHLPTHWIYIVIPSFECILYTRYAVPIHMLILHKSSSTDTSAAYTLQICLKFAINANHISVQNLRIVTIHRKACMLSTPSLIKYAAILCEHKNTYRFSFRISKSTPSKRTDCNHTYSFFFHCISSTSRSRIGLMIYVYRELEIRTTNPKTTELFQSKKWLMCILSNERYHSTYTHVRKCIDSSFTCPHSQPHFEHSMSVWQYSSTKTFNTNT